MRLQKFLATAGVASRRASEKIVAEGRVKLNDETVTDPARDVTDADRVTVDGRTITAVTQRVVYAVHKSPPPLIPRAGRPSWRSCAPRCASTPWAASTPNPRA
jgi:16S rRNA U516 pseudouridylate synthase RsuA-like enzyme